MPHRGAERCRYPLKGNEGTYFRIVQAERAMTPITSVNKGSNGKVNCVLPTYKQPCTFIFAQSNDGLQLTPRQKDVVMSILEGPDDINTNAKRAKTLGISKYTFMRHLEKIKDRLAETSAVHPGSMTMRPENMADIIFTLWLVGCLKVVPLSAKPQT